MMKKSRGGEKMKKRGFTLIELLVVIAIIGLLSTLAVVALGSARTKGRDAVRVSDAKNLQMALELYFNDNSAYPTAAVAVNLGEGDVLCLDKAGFQTLAGCTHTPIYMQVIPKDPQSSQHYAYTSADGKTYTIGLTLEGTVNNMTGAIQATPSAIVDVAEPAP